MSSSGEHSIILDIEEYPDDNKLKLICENDSNSDKNIEYFVLKALNENGNVIVNNIYKNREFFKGKIISDFRNIDIKSI